MYQDIASSRTFATSQAGIVDQPMSETQFRITIALFGLMTTASIVVVVQMIASL